MLVSALWAMIGTMAHAQTNGSNSPYSRYGYGLLSDGAQGFNKGMSGLSYGMRGGNLLNTQNPASIAALDSLTFLYDLGITLQNANISDGTNKVNAKNSSFDYLTAGFRLGRGLGVYVGMRPFSTIGYDVASTETLSDAGTGSSTVTHTNSGNGGFHEAGVGLGWNPFGGLSIGAEFNYFWGDYTRSTVSTYSQSGVQPLNRYYTAEINSYRIGFGAQYDAKINKNNNLTLGAVYRLGHDIGSEAVYYNQRLSSSGSVISGDTVRISKAFSLPTTIGAGVVWTNRNRLRIGFDYTLELWKDLHFAELGSNGTYSLSTDYFTNRSSYTLGFDYKPNPEGLRYRDHITYRFGVKYSTPYIKVDGYDGPKSYLVSAGVGLPISNLYNVGNTLNLSVQWEHVKPSRTSMITENYLRLSVGLTFNESWFMKWKVK